MPSYEEIAARVQSRLGSTARAPTNQSLREYRSSIREARSNGIAIIEPIFDAIQITSADIRALSLDMLASLRKNATRIKQDMRQPTKGWSHKPKFQHTLRLARKAGEVGLYVFTDDEVWIRLNNGTAYRTAIVGRGYEPMTAPGTIYPTGGKGGSTVATVSDPSLYRPGIVAREWTTILTRKWQDEIYLDIADILTRFFSTRSLQNDRRARSASGGIRGTKIVE